MPSGSRWHQTPRGPEGGKEAEADRGDKSRSEKRLRDSLDPYVFDVTEPLNEFYFWHLPAYRTYPRCPYPRFQTHYSSEKKLHSWDLSGKKPQIEHRRPGLWLCDLGSHQIPLDANFTTLKEQETTYPTISNSKVL